MVPKTVRKLKKARIVESAPLRLDIGCGPNKRDGFHGVDQYAFGGKVDTVMDVRLLWPWKSNSVAEIHASHFLEHLTAVERCHVVNEMWRVLKPCRKENGVNKEGFATIVCPAWSSNRAYGDPTHQWPPMCEMWFWYLSKEWRAANAPHTDAEHWDKGFNCDFLFTQGYSMHQGILGRNEEYRQYALTWYKEAAQDIVATLEARK